MTAHCPIAFPHQDFSPHDAELLATGVSAGSRGVCPQLTTAATRTKEEEQPLGRMRERC